MDTGGAMVAHLRIAGCELACEGGQLRARGPLTDDLRAMITQHKAAILAYLAEEAAANEAPDPAPAPAAEDTDNSVPWRQALGLDVAPVAEFSVTWGQKTADGQSWLRLRDPYTGIWHEIPTKGTDKWLFVQLPGRQEEA